MGQAQPACSPESFSALGIGQGLVFYFTHVIPPEWRYAVKNAPGKGLLVVESDKEVQSHLNLPKDKSNGQIVARSQKVRSCLG